MGQKLLSDIAREIFGKYNQLQNEGLNLVLNLVLVLVPDHDNTNSRISGGCTRTRFKC